MNIFIHESQNRIEFRMINKNYWYIIIIIDRKFIYLNEINIKENDDNDDNNNNSYNQIIIYSMRIINKIYTQFQDLIQIFSPESIDIFHNIFNHW